MQNVRTYFEEARRIRLQYERMGNAADQRSLEIRRWLKNRYGEIESLLAMRESSESKNSTDESNTTTEVPSHGQEEAGFGSAFWQERGTAVQTSKEVSSQGQVEDLARADEQAEMEPPQDLDTASMISNPSPCAGLEEEPKPSTSEEETKVCPICAETVKHAALKCRYCGHEFTKLPTVATPPPISVLAQYDLGPTVVRNRPNAHLKQCPDCGNFLSAKAITCPTCGRVVHDKSYFTKDIGCMGAVYVLLCLLGLATFPAGGFILVIIGGIGLWARLKSWRGVGFK